MKGRWLALLALAVLCGLGLWVRFAPISADVVHRMGAAARDIGDWPDPEGFEAVRQVPAPKAALSDLIKIALANGQTELLEGDADEGLVTLVTRSSLIGLPDITNLWIEGDRVHLRGHSVFEIIDLGGETRRAQERIRDWLALAGLK